MTDTPADTTSELSPAEIATAIEALPTAGHICVLTPRVEALEQKVAELAAFIASPAGHVHDARIAALEDAVSVIGPALAQHFGIKI